MMSPLHFRTEGNGVAESKVVAGNAALEALLNDIFSAS
jgi:hypothetical protein